MLKNIDDEDHGLEINLARVALEISQMYARRQELSFMSVTSNGPFPLPIIHSLLQLSIGFCVLNSSQAFSPSFYKDHSQGLKSQHLCQSRLPLPHSLQV